MAEETDEIAEKQQIKTEHMLSILKTTSEYLGKLLQKVDPGEWHVGRWGDGSKPTMYQIFCDEGETVIAHDILIRENAKLISVSKHVVTALKNDIDRFLEYHSEHQYDAHLLYRDLINKSKDCEQLIESLTSDSAEGKVSSDAA